MEKHQDSVVGYEGTLEDLAHAVGGMKYAAAAKFLGELGQDIERQAKADEVKGRVQLSSQLYSTARELYKASEEMQAAWKICEPHM
ncbi:hypothetical protein GOV14_03005 [Candidatus Pacearchaeota archaeon]|nr:hypothetical protein [Candidatus Pacearchaeota archaeon]